ncbi:hypothetical protein PV735_10630 [Streptomyces turgidiscabies]|uniref:Uncharacterized protein n=1 Tax=Streptomyces turgidiscabies (strain Car8) TaxID=698760 RepID=L7F7E0_STRT8|nr:MULTISPECIES: hypothetical protein [Streptomyces]ELP67147.1 hypothetical protein STRTUCAR8_06299 [Streptomyces turgidiscabies Car8]MDX3493143.1 hypothetical protein [Streptomyces turgidiscabies]GAQ70440.1 hypothetical protein T45_02175 [Streptomyces turgidiscabies]
MTGAPESGTPEADHQEESWLGAKKVSELWQVRKDYVPRVASLADVRVRKYGGESLGTYGVALTYYHYHPEDVRRAATAVAEGRFDIPSVWRLDTRNGRLAEYWTLFMFRLGCLIGVALFLSMIWMLVRELTSS